MRRLDSRRGSAVVSKWLVLGGALGAVLASGGCERCGPSGPKEPLELVDPQAIGLLQIPDLAAFARGAEEFTTRVTRKSPAMATSMRESLRAQLLFDPFDGSAYEKVGIDPKGGVTLFTEADHPVAVAALRLTDREVFEQGLAALVKQLDGADQRSVTPFEGTEIFTIGRPFGDQTVAVVHGLFLGKFVLLTSAEGLPALQAAWKRLHGAEPARPSLHDDPELAAALKRVPEGLVRLRLRGAAAALIAKDAPAAVDEVMLTLSPGAQGLNADLFARVPAKGLEQALGVGPAIDLLGRIEPDAVVLGAGRGAGLAGLQALRTVAPLRPQLDSLLGQLQRSTGVDVEKEGLQHFLGPITVGVHLHDLPSLPARMQSRQLSQALDVFHVALVAELKDGAAMRELLGRSQLALQGSGAKLRSRTLKVGDADAVIFEPDVAAPKLGWGVWKNWYVYGAGVGRAERTLHHVAQAAGGAPSTIAATLGPVSTELLRDSGTSVLVVRAGAIADAAVQAEIAGPFAGIVGSLVEILRALGDVTLALHAEPDGLRLKVREQIQ